MTSELEKLEANLGGVADLKRQPDAMFVIDLKKEQLAVREARRLGVPVVGLVDTNADPDEADFVIPGNDDAIRSCELIVRAIAQGIEAGQNKVTEQEFASNGNGGAPAEAAAEAEPAGEAAPAAEAEPTAETEPELEETAEEVAEDPQFEVMSSSEHAEAPEPGPEDPIPSANELGDKTEKSAEAISLEQSEREMEKEGQ